LQDHFVLFEFLFGFVFDEQVADLFETIIEDDDRFFRIGFVQCGQCSGLGSMEQDKGSVLLVAHAPFFVGRVVTADVHECQSMVSILDGAVVMLKTEPGDSAVVVLEEFAVGFKALVIVHGKVWGLFFDGEHAIQEGREALDRQSVGAALGFHLKDP